MVGTNRTAEYKGKKYRLLFLGDTKYGKRAHLQFFSGDKDFWVDARLVSVGVGDTGSGVKVSDQSKSSRNVCAECGKPGYLVRDLEDGMYKHPRCCDIEP